MVCKLKETMKTIGKKERENNGWSQKTDKGKLKDILDAESLMLHPSTILFLPCGFICLYLSCVCTSPNALFSLLHNKRMALITVILHAATELQCTDMNTDAVLCLTMCMYKYTQIHSQTKSLLMDWSHIHKHTHKHTDTHVHTHKQWALTHSFSPVYPDRQYRSWLREGGADLWGNFNRLQFPSRHSHLSLASWLSIRGALMSFSVQWGVHHVDDVFGLGYVWIMFHFH